MAPGRLRAHTFFTVADIPPPPALTQIAEAIMSIEPLIAAAAARYELRFQSLFHTGRGVSFPCDRQGAVHWEALSERARASFLRAQEQVGREYAAPAVMPS